MIHGWVRRPPHGPTNIYFYHYGSWPFQGGAFYMVFFVNSCVQWFTSDSLRRFYCTRKRHLGQEHVCWVLGVDLIVLALEFFYLVYILDFFNKIMQIYINSKCLAWIERCITVSFTLRVFPYAHALWPNSERFSTDKQYVICLSETCNGLRSLSYQVQKHWDNSESCHICRLQCVK